MKLEWKTALWSALVSTALHAPALAQEQEPPQDGDGSSLPRTGKVAPRTKVPVIVPVEGIEVDQVGGLVEAVLAMRHEVYTCPTCSLKGRSAGPCEQCEVELEAAESSEVMGRVELAVDRRYLSVTLEPHHWGSLAEIDAVLVPFGAGVKRSGFRIPPYSRLSVAGLEDEKAAKRLRSALVDLKVLPSVTVAFDPDTKLGWLSPRVDAENVTVGDVEAVLAKMRGEYTLVDVQWAAYCPTCGTRPISEMGSPMCRAD